MYTMIICRNFGYAIEMLASFDRALARFTKVIDEDDTTTAVFYGRNGEQINAYAKPGDFEARAKS